MVLELLSNRLRVGTMFLVFFMFVSNASATTMVFADLERMIEISDIIVEGTVVKQNTFVSEKLGGHLVTTTTIRTKQMFHGEKKEYYSFTQWGGELDGTMAKIPGDAAFKIGEDVVLFLTKPKHANEKGHLFLSLLAQSKYSVSLGETKMVSRDLSDVAFLNPKTSEYSKRRDDIFKYEAFVAELKTQIAGIKGGKK